MTKSLFIKDLPKMRLIEIEITEIIVSNKSVTRKVFQTNLTDEEAVKRLTAWCEIQESWGTKTSFIILNSKETPTLYRRLPFIEHLPNE